MTEDDLSERLRRANLSAEELRLFACACCERALKWFDLQMMNELVDLGRQRAAGRAGAATIDATRKKSVALYDSMYPGYGDPSAEVLALSAAGEVAFTENPLTAARHAADFAAQAIAKYSASKSGEQGDGRKKRKELFDRERKAQYKLLSGMARRSS